MRSGAFFSPAALGAAFAIVAAALALGLGPADTFWTVDDAGKDLVLRNVVRHPGDPTLDYPGRALDPRLRVFPMPLDGPEPYAARRGDRVVSQYASPFVWLAWPLARVSLPLGHLLLPALGAGAAIFATGLLGRRLGGQARTGALAAGIAAVASPLAFYGAVFWEHTLTVALVGGAFATLARSDPRFLRAGLLLGAAALLREELALLVVALVGVTVLERPSFRAAASLLAGAAPGLGARVAFQLWTSGSWLGVHGALNRPEPFAHAGETMDRLLLGTGASGWPAAAAAGAIAVLALGRFLAARGAAGPEPSAPARRTPLVTALFASGAFVVAVIAIQAFRFFPDGKDAALALQRSNSALLVLPWALVAPFLASATPASEESARAAERLLGRAALVFLVLFAALVPARSITGVHPGPRMLLPLLLLAAALTATRMDRRRFAALLLIPLLLIGAAWNVRSLELLHAKRGLAGELAAALRARPERTVVTDLFWLPTEMSALWDAKRFLLLRSDRDLAWVVDRARDAGETSILAAVTPGRIDAEPVAAVRDASLPAFSVDLHQLTLHTVAAPPPGTGP